MPRRRSQARSRKSRASRSRARRKDRVVNGKKASSRRSRSPSHDVKFDEVQSVVFDKDYWDLEEAREWLKEHGYKAGEPDETKNTYRFRQFEPKYGSTWDFAMKTIRSATKKLPISLNLNFNVV